MPPKSKRERVPRDREHAMKATSTEQTKEANFSGGVGARHMLLDLAKEFGCSELASRSIGLASWDKIGRAHV